MVLSTLPVRSNSVHKTFKLLIQSIVFQNSTSDTQDLFSSLQTPKEVTITIFFFFFWGGGGGGGLLHSDGHFATSCYFFSRCFFLFNSDRDCDHYIMNLYVWSSRISVTPQDINVKPKFVLRQSGLPTQVGFLFLNAFFYFPFVTTNFLVRREVCEIRYTYCLQPLAIIYRKT